MNPVVVDPDIKVNMSLDEIIHLTRDQIRSQLSWRGLRGTKRKKRFRRRSTENMEHSVPLLKSQGGVGIYVSKKSCLLNTENRKRIADALANRAMNSSLIEKSKKVIPAEYKLIRTCTGVERVLVPTAEYFSESSRKKLVPPRKLSKGRLKDDSVSDCPPPLISSRIYTAPDVENMQVDSDDEITILEDTQSGKLCEVIDVESDIPTEVLEAKALCFGNGIVNQGNTKTLTERFTLLTGNFKF